MVDPQYGKDQLIYALEVQKAMIKDGMSFAISFVNVFIFTDLPVHYIMSAHKNSTDGMKFGSQHSKN